MRTSPPESIWVTLAKRPAAPPWNWGDVGITVVILAGATLFIASAIAAVTATDAAQPAPINFVMGWTISLAIVLAFILIRWYSKQERFAALALGVGSRPVGLMLLLGIATAFTVDLIAAAGSGGFYPIAVLTGVDRAQVSQLIISAVLVVLVQPVAEGLVFYGVILPRARASLGGWPGLLFTAVVFAAYHALVYGVFLPQNSQLWHGLIYPLLIGIALGMVRVYAASTRAAIAAYVGVGLSAIIVFLVIT